MNRPAGMKTEAPAEWAFVALGSNLGDSIRIIPQAIDQLAALSSSPLLRSSLWRTTPMDCPTGSADFINAAVGFAPRSGETPETLLQHLQRLEAEFGRKPKKAWNEARPLDLDLIAFGSQIRPAPALILPHPRAHLRRFVLAPLAEIAPHLCLPGQARAIHELLATLVTDETVSRIEP